MIVIEVDGVRYEAENEKEARKLMRKASAAARKASAERDAKRATARMKAESAAYRVLSRKLDPDADSFPRGWTFYTPQDKWAQHMFVEKAGERFTHKINAQDGEVEVDHYGNVLVGGVCNGGGFCWLLFLQDKDHADWAPMCCAIGVHEGEYCLVSCPGISIGDFRTSKQEEEAA